MVGKGWKPCMDLKTLLDTPPWEWPRNTGKRFLDVLTNQRASESDRLIAAELAGDSTVVNDELADVLTALAGNPKESEELRAKAAIALGPALELASVDEFDDPEMVPITESTFDKIVDSLERLHRDPTASKLVRRRVLEASVRAPQPWHREAIRAAYTSGDRDWILTAVFSMRYVRGFDDWILESLKNPDPEIHGEAIDAAGTWELDAAWPHVVALVKDPATPKELLFEAIEAVGTIRPAEARDVLEDLLDSDDEEIAEAADEAIEMAEAAADLDEDGDEDDDEDESQDDWVN
jgi:hypothetical protein